MTKDMQWVSILGVPLEGGCHTQREGRNTHAHIFIPYEYALSGSQWEGYAFDRAGITVILFFCLTDDLFLAILNGQPVQGNGKHFAFTDAIIHTEKIKFISQNCSNVHLWG